LKNWSFSTVDADGMSGGLLSGWSPNFKDLSSSYVRSSIFVKLKHKDYDFVYSAINIYGLVTSPRGTLEFSFWLHHCKHKDAS
jgi:hypothetical protein